MKTKISAYLILFSLVFLSCRKDEAAKNVDITSKVWKPALIDKNKATNPIANDFGLVSYHRPKDCEKDDTFKFGHDGKLTIDRGTLPCNAAEERTEVQTYSLNRSTNELVINGLKYTLAEASKTQLKYYAPLPHTTGYQFIIFIFE